MNLLEKIGMFIFYFAFKFIYVTLILLFLLIYHNSLFDHMLRSPQRSHRKTYYFITTAANHLYLTVTIFKGKKYTFFF